MSRFPVPEDPDARRALRELYREMGVAEGQVPSNFFTGMALRPDLLRGAWALTRAMTAGQVPPVLRELILTAVAAGNQAHYCCLSHAAALKRLGAPPELVESAKGDPALLALAPEDRALVAFAVKVSKDPNGVKAADFKELRAHGHSDGFLMEVILLAAFANWSNTWSSAADVILD